MTTGRTKSASAGVRGERGEALSSSIRGTRPRTEQRHEMIAAAAYFRAEQRGFCGDACLDDWLTAEAEVDARLRQTKASAGRN